MEEIEIFFRNFEKYSNLNDADGLASMFADSFLNADHSGTRVVQARDLRMFIPKRKQVFESIGYKSTKLVSVNQTKLDDRYILVRAEWRFEFDRDDVTVPSTYIVENSGGSLKIVFYLAHQNIMAVLKDRGLLPQDKL